MKCNLKKSLRNTQQDAHAGSVAIWPRYTIRYDTIEEINVDSKAEYTA